MENLELYLSVAATILGLFVSTITFLIKLIKKSKLKKVFEDIVLIMENIIPFIEEAERFIHYTGEEKKAYVMTKATQIIINKKMKVNLNDVSDKIDELISLTKQVNIKNVNRTDGTYNENNLLRTNYNPSNELMKLKR